ncbi:MAG: vitamin K epoxide reductase family protein [bacterium]|nr:vitamin K epoxide reductase family protein [bacterium]
MKKKLVVSLIILSFLGLLDAAYLTITHYQNTAPFCNIEHPCSIVLTSQFATLGSLPIALLGAIYYLLVLIYSLFLLKERKRFALLGFVALAGLGFIISVVLFLIQAFILHAFCLYCIFSEVISVLLLTFSLILLRLGYDEKSKN